MRPRTVADTPRDAGDRRDDPDVSSHLHIGADGVDVVLDGETIDPVDDSPADGPTVCRDLDDEKFFDQLDGALVGIDDDGQITSWVQGFHEIAVVVDTDVAWGDLMRVTQLFSDPTHPRRDIEFPAERSFDSVNVVERQGDRQPHRRPSIRLGHFLKAPLPTVGRRSPCTPLVAPAILADRLVHPTRSPERS